METTPSFSNYLDMDNALAYAHKTDSRINENSKQIIETRNELTAMKNEFKQNKRTIDRDFEIMDAYIRESHKLNKEIRQIIKETTLQMKETDLQMKETDRKIKEISTRFNSTIGNIMEGLMSPSSFKIFKKAGFHINRCLRNVKRKNKEPLLAMELDALMIGDTEIIALEVKSSCDCQDIDKFLFHMERFRTLFPEYDKLNLNVYVAIASLNYENEADLYAQKQGLLVIRVSEEEIFTLDPFDNQNLRIF